MKENFKFFQTVQQQILREIKVGESRVSKYVILTHLEAVNFDFFMNFCTFRRQKLTKSTKFKGPKMAKNDSFSTVRFFKFDFTLNLSAETSTW